MECTVRCGQGLLPSVLLPPGRGYRLREPPALPRATEPDQEIAAPRRIYELRIYLVSHGCNRRSCGKRFCVGNLSRSSFSPKKWSPWAWGDVNRREILAAAGYRIPRIPLLMLDGQEGINEDGIAFAIKKRDRIGNPCEIFLPGRKAFGRATAFLGQKLPSELWHYLRSLRLLFN